MVTKLITLEFINTKVSRIYVPEIEAREVCLEERHLNSMELEKNNFKGNHNYQEAIG